MIKSVTNLQPPGLNPVPALFARFKASKPPSAIRHYIKLQRAGNCVVHSFNALMLFLFLRAAKTKKEGIFRYKTAIVFVKTYGLSAHFQYHKEFFYSHFAGVSNEAKEGLQFMRVIFESSARALQRVCKKGYQKKLPRDLVDTALATALDALKQVKNAPPIILETPKIPSTKVEKSSVIEWMRTLKREQIEEGGFKAHAASSPQTFPIPESYSSFKEIVEELCAFNSGTSRERLEHLFYIETFMESIPLSFRDSDSFWGALTQEEAACLLQQVSTLSYRYGEVVQHEKAEISPRFFNTAETFQAVAFELARIIDRYQGGVFFEGVKYPTFRKAFSAQEVVNAIKSKDKGTRAQEMDQYYYSLEGNELMIVKEGALDQEDLQPYLQLLDCDPSLFKRLCSFIYSHPFFQRSSLDDRFLAAALLFIDIEEPFEIVEDRKEVQLEVNTSFLAGQYTHILTFKKFMINFCRITGFIRKRVYSIGERRPILDFSNNLESVRGLFFDHTEEYPSLICSKFLQSAKKDLFPEFCEVPYLRNPSENQLIEYGLRFPKGVQTLMRSYRNSNNIRLFEEALNHLYLFSGRHTEQEGVIYRTLFEWLFLLSQSHSHDFAYEKFFHEAFQEFLERPGLTKFLVEEMLWMVRIQVSLAQRKKKPAIPQFCHALNEPLKALGYSSLLDLLTQWLEEEAIPVEKKEAIHLHRLYLLTLEEPEVLDSEHWALFFESWLHLVSKDQLNQLTESRALIFEVNEWGQRAQALFYEEKHHDLELLNHVCEHVLRSSVSIHSHSEGWEEEGYPLISRKGKEKWTLDLVSGEISSKEGVLQALRQFICQDEDFRRLIGDSTVLGRYKGQNFYFEDAVWGSVRILNGNVSEGVQVKIEGSWFSYLPWGENNTLLDSYNLYLPLAITEDFHLFYSSDSSLTHPFLAINRYSHELTFRGNTEGNLFVRYEDTWHLLDLTFSKKALPFIATFEDPSYVLVTQNRGKREHFLFPRLKDEQGEMLAFERAAVELEGSDEPQEVWIYSKERDYHLIEYSRFTPFGDLRTCFLLQHHSKPHKKRCLIRDDKVKRSYVYQTAYQSDIQCSSRSAVSWGSVPFIDIKWSEDFPGLEVKNPRHKLRLVVIFLFQRRYYEALQQIRGIRAVDELYSFSNYVECLTDVINNLDHSGEKSSVSLAFSLGFLVEIQYEKSLEKWVGVIKKEYLNYLSKESSVPPQCRLSVGDERLLLKTLKLPENLYDTRKKWLEEQERQEIFESRRVGRNDSLRERLVEPFLEEREGGDAIPSFPHQFSYDHPESLDTLLMYWEENSPRLLTKTEAYPVKDFWLQFLLLNHPELPQDKKDLLFYRLSQMVYSCRDKRSYLKAFAVAYLFGGIELPAEGEPFSVWLDRICQSVSLPKKPTKRDHIFFKESYRVEEKKRVSEVAILGEETLQLPPVDGSLRVLREKYCGEDFTRESSLTSTPFELFIDPKELKEEEKLFSSMIQNKCAFYQTGMKNVAKSSLTPNLELEGEAYTQFKEDLFKQIAATEDLCEKLKGMIQKGIQAPTLDKKRQYEKIAEAEHPGTAESIFADCLRTVSTAEDEKAFLKGLQLFNPDFTLEAAFQIRLLVKGYLEQETETFQLNRISKSLKKIEKIRHKERIALRDEKEIAIHWRAITTVLQSVRTYSPDDLEALFFEYASRLRIRDKQADVIEDVSDHLFKKKKASAKVIQMGMGEGKTSVVIDRLINSALREGEIPVICSHHSQQGATLSNTATFQKDRYERDLIPLSLKREDFKNSNKLDWALQKVEEVKKEKLPLAIPTTLTQEIELGILTTLETGRVDENGEISPNLKETLQGLNALSAFFKEETFSILDEIPLNGDIFFGVHYPSGEQKTLKRSRVTLIRKLYVQMLQNPELSSLIQLAGNTQNYLSREQYHSIVAPKLARYLVKEGGIPNLPEEYYDEALAFILNRIPKIFSHGETKYFYANVVQGHHPELNRCHLSEDVQRNLAFLTILREDFYQSLDEELKETAHLTAVAKYVLTVILPKCLELRENSHYGKNSKGKVIPFHGGEPTKTEIADIYKQTCLQMQATANRGLTLSDIKCFVDTMYTAALAEATEMSLSIKNTSRAFLVKEVFGLSLDKVPQEIEERTAYYQKALKKLEKDREVALLIQEELAGEFLTFVPHVFSSSSIDKMTHHRTYFGCSGTLEGKESFAFLLAQNTAHNPEVEGKILHHALETFAAGRSHIHMIEEISIPSILNQVFEVRQGKKERARVRCLIDSAGLFVDFTAQQIAKKILGYFEKGVKAVVYVKDDQFILLEKGKGKIPQILPDTSLKTFKALGFKTKDLFFYCDRLRSVGTDFPLPFDAVAVQTVNPREQILSQDLQGSLRCRGFFHEQHVDKVCPIQAEPFLLPGENLLVSIYKTLIKNEAILEAAKNLYSFEQQIHSSARTEVFLLLRVLIADEKWSDLFSLYRTARSLFVTVNENDPFSAYGDLREEGEAMERLVRQKEATMKFYRAIAKSHPKLFKAYPQILKPEQIEEYLDALIDYAREKELFSYTCDLSIRSSSGDQDVQVNQEVQNTVTVNQAIDVDHTVDADVEAEYASYALERVTFVKEEEWGIPIGASIEEVEEILANQTLSLSEVFAQRDDRRYASYSELFPENLFVTRNFMRTVEENVTIFHEASKTPFGVLFYPPSNGEGLRFVLLSFEEYSSFQKYEGGFDYLDLSRLLIKALNFEIQQLEDDSSSSSLPPSPVFWVSDTENLECIGREIDDAIAEQMDQTLIAINIFKGNVPYLVREREKVEPFLKASPEFFEKACRFLKVRAYGNQEYQIILAQDSLFNHKEKKVLPSSLLKRLEETAKLKGAFKVDDSEVPLLDHADAVFRLPSHQVPLLSFEQLQKFPLRPSRYKHVAVKNLPDHALCYIQTDAQMEALIVQIEKGERSLDVLKHLFREEKYRHLQLSWIPNAWLRELDFEVVKFLSPSKVKWLADEQIPVLSSEAQVRALSPERVHLLNPVYFKYLEDPQQLKAFFADPAFARQHLDRFLYGTQLQYAPKEILRAQDWSLIAAIPNLSEEGIALIHSLPLDGEEEYCFAEYAPQMNYPQLLVLEEAQLESLDTEQLARFCSQFGAEEIARIEERQAKFLEHLTAEQCCHLSQEWIGKLDRECLFTVSRDTPMKMRDLNSNQWSWLDSEFFQELVSSLPEELSLELIHAVPEEHVALLTESQIQARFFQSRIKSIAYRIFGLFEAVFFLAVVPGYVLYELAKLVGKIILFRFDGVKKQVWKTFAVAPLRGLMGGVRLGSPASHMHAVSCLNRWAL